MAILNNNPLVGASGNQGGYNINNSLRFRSSASATLSRTPASTTNQNTFTFSFWMKKGKLGSSSRFYVGRTSTNFPAFGLQIDDSLMCDQYTNGGVLQLQLITTQVFRDPSAWYHIVIAFDTTQATSSNRIKFYVNGSQITAFSTATYPSQNLAINVNTTNTQYIGGDPAQPFYWDGYMAEFNFIDGSAKTPSDFGETDTTTGVWKPKAYTGTYGTNGFYLKFSDIATTSGSNAGLGKDFSGNSNYWTTNNISVTSGVTYDAMTDSPTNTSATVANYAVLSPIDQAGGPPSGGNLDLTISAGTSNCVAGTIAVSSGKWYWEVTIGSTTNANWMVGIADSSGTIASRAWTGANGWYYFTNGNKYNNNSGTAYGSSYTTGDVIGIALDMDAGTVVFYKNNVSQGTAFSSLTGKTMQAALGNGTGGGTQTYNINFGQRPFSYTPPTGFVALNTFNLPTPTILQGNKYMDATLWTGGQSSPFSVTNAGLFKPDLVWAKYRTAAASHRLYDSVRGSGIALYSNGTSAEGTETNQGVSAFQTSGFQITNSNGVAPYLNDTSQTYVGWQWQAGQGSTSSNTSGSITSTVSVNTTAGFSVVTYTGNGTGSATVGHGLGVTPKMIIYKRRNDIGNWIVYHTSLGNNGSNYAFLEMNTTSATQTVSSYLPVGGLSSTTFMTGTTGSVNASGGTYVAYCWAAISGFSAFGSYTGNGSTDGPFNYVGFRPKFIMLKRTDTTGNWTMYDATRNTYNAGSYPLYPNLSNAEDASIDHFDWLSNGFKMKSTNQNASGGTFIYACFASNPFKNSNAV